MIADRSARLSVQGTQNASNKGQTARSKYGSGLRRHQHIPTGVAALSWSQSFSQVPPTRQRRGIGINNTQLASLLQGGYQILSPCWLPSDTTNREQDEAIRSAI